jgi:hypothetical protein
MCCDGGSDFHDSIGSIGSTGSIGPTAEVWLEDVQSLLRPGLTRDEPGTEGSEGC